MLRGNGTPFRITPALRLLAMLLGAALLAVPGLPSRSMPRHARTTRQRKHHRPKPKPAEADDLADLPMPDLRTSAPATKLARPKVAPHPTLRKPLPPPPAVDDDEECDEDDEDCEDEEETESAPRAEAPAPPEVIFAAAQPDAPKGTLLASADLGLVPTSPAVRQRIRSGARSKRRPVEDDDEDVEQALTLAAELDTTSRYQWHGLTIVDGPTLQPSARASYRGFELSTAMSLPLVAGSSSHVADVSAEVAHVTQLGPYALRPSVEAMVFPGQALPSTTELGVSVAAKVHGPFSLVTQHHVDVLAHPGAYFGEMGFQFAPELSPTLSLETAASWGVASGAFNDAYFGVDRFTLNVVEGRAQLTWAPVEPFYVGPHAEFAVLVDPELRSAAPHAQQVALGLVGGCLW